MSRAERLLNLMDALRRHRCPVSGQELAATLRVSIRTLYRDIASLRALGAGIEGEPGLGYVLKRGFVLPPVMFSAEEVDALILGARWVVESADAPLGEAARKAIARLTAVMPEDLVRRVEAQYLLVGPRERAKSDSVDVSHIRHAIHRERKLRIRYGDVKGETTERVIWPFLLSYFEGGRLVSAWCELRGDIRHFRTDRIVALAESSERYPRRRHDLMSLWREAEASAACKPMTTATF
jgi:predicted DNA-binding transcriptional regulator YafY